MYLLPLTKQLLAFVILKIAPWLQLITPPPPPPHTHAHNYCLIRTQANDDSKQKRSLLIN